MTMTFRQLEDLVLKELVAVSGLKETAFTSSQGFAEMGIESLQAIHIVSRLNDALKDVLPEPLSPILMFDYPSIAELARYIFSNQIGKLKPAASAVVGSAGVKKVAAEPVSIVGMSCRMPSAENLDEFHALLREGRDCIRTMGASRVGDFTKPIDTLGMVDDIDLFANGVFGITENEARRMDPQQRLLLEETWHAIEDAGYAPSEWRGQQVGVYVGISSSDYARALQGAKYADIFSATGNAHSIAANRISYVFDFRGPSVAVDTACSSSLVALDMAVQALRSGQVDWAVCAGVNLVLNPELSQAFADAMMLSPDGRCFTFSQRANGYVRGEGVGVLILRRRSDAEKDHCRIYADVLSTAVNQDGHSSSLTAPNGKAQEAVILQAIHAAGLLPQDIAYHEAHGTGTALGDPIEFLALERVHVSRASGSAPLIVGSVKTNIGHLEAAAGVAGLIKTALSLYHRTLFPHLHFDVINPQIGARAKNVEVGTDLREWSLNSDDQIRRASVSSFGFGGTNAHAVLGEVTKSIDVKLTPSVDGWPLAFLVSSDSDEGLKAMAVKLKERLISSEASNTEKLDLTELSNALLETRRDLGQRILFSSNSISEITDILGNYAEGRPDARIRKLPRPKKMDSNTAFLFTGQGAQYTKMYWPLYKAHPGFKSKVDSLLRRAQNFFPNSLLDIWSDESNAESLAQTDHGQVLLFVLELSFAQHLEATIGRKPDVVFGHSVGEIIAAVYAGYLSLDDGIKLVISRSHLMRSTKPGAMLAVYTKLDRLQEILLESGGVDLAANNGPDLQVVSGLESDISKLEEALAKLNVRSKRLEVRQAFHSQTMDEVLDPFMNSIEGITVREGSIPIVSSLTGDALAFGAKVSTKLGDVDAFSPGYWRAQLRSTTQFERGLRALSEQFVNVLVEVGPQATLVSMGQRFYPDKKSEWIYFFGREDQTLATYVHGVETLVSLDLVRAALKARKNQLPLTSWSRKRFWIDRPTSSSVATSAVMSPPPQLHPVKMQEKKMTQVRDQKLQEIQVKLVEVMAQAMKVGPDEVDMNESLVDLGADSLVLLNAVQTIKDTYHVSIPISEVFKDLNTLSKIAEFIVQETHVDEPEPQISERSNLPTASLQNFSGVDSQNVALILAGIQAQIALLGQQMGSSASAASMPMQKSAPAEKVSSQPSTQNKIVSDAKRGVLGNFKGFAEKQVQKEDSAEKERFVTNFISRFNSRTKKSKAHAQKYRAVLADNRVSAGFRPTTKEMTYPIHFVNAKGSHFNDLDGNELIDFTMGFGNGGRAPVASGRRSGRTDVTDHRSRAGGLR
jgi:acyl transferase domain-containing protein